MKLSLVVPMTLAIVGCSKAQAVEPIRPDNATPSRWTCILDSGLSPMQRFAALDAIQDWEVATNYAFRCQRYVADSQIVNGNVLIRWDEDGAGYGNAARTTWLGDGTAVLHIRQYEPGKTETALRHEIGHALRLRFDCTDERHACNGRHSVMRPNIDEDASDVTTEDVRAFRQVWGG